MISVEADDNNELCLILILEKYYLLCIKELTYYGTSDTNQMFFLISIGQELSRLENKITQEYWNYYIDNMTTEPTELTKLTEPNIYYLRKILFEIFNTLLLMITLWIENKKESEEFEYKSRYLVGYIENFIDKFINPILPKLKLLVCSNKIFKTEYSLANLKKFIILNKNKFTNSNRLVQLDKFIKTLE